MLTKIKAFALTLLFSTTVSFGSDFYANKNSGKKEKTTTTKKIALDTPTKMQINKVLELNENLHNAFFNYAGVKVEKAAGPVLAELNKITHPELKKLLTFAGKKLARIKAENKRELNNQNYHIVSSAFIVILNKYDIGAKYSAYSCPMVRKKWLQNSKKVSGVHNPYAEKMPHCGEKLKQQK